MDWSYLAKLEWLIFELLLLLFFVWQWRSLKRDKALLRAQREREARAAQQDPVAAPAPPQERKALEEQAGRKAPEAQAGREPLGMQPGPGGATDPRRS